MASHWLKALLAALIAMAIGATPAGAQKPLPLKAGKAWKHEHSGISIPATLAGTPRDRGAAYAADDLDVGPRRMRRRTAAPT